jgi:hypothetical protein
MVMCINSFLLNALFYWGKAVLSSIVDKHINGLLAPVK